MIAAVPRAADDGAPPWSLPRRLGFRFLVAYFGLFFFPPPLPGFEWLSALWNRGCTRVTLWVAAHVVHLGRALDTTDNGSADTTAAWLQLGWSFALAIVAAVVWTLVDRRRRDDRLAAIARVYLRYVVALVMITFGLVKLIGLQFPPLMPIRLLQRIGDQSPMGLLWTFMGYSRAYNVFAGGLELAGALLLLFRRTVALGALLTLAAMTQVALLNFCYDVPVKTLAVHLWLAALVLLAPDLRRLAAALTTAGPPLVAVRRRRLRVAAAAAHLAFIALVLAAQLRGLRAFAADFQGGTPPALFGAWDIEQGSPADWRRVGFGEGRMAVHLADGSVAGRWRAVADEAAHTLAVRAEPDDGRAPTTLRYRAVDPTHLELDGAVGGVACHARLRKRDTSHMELVSRRFHWISEVYYNR